MFHDSITGLPALESFLEFAEKMWKTSNPNRFAILSVNIGSFHEVNQHYGYEQGNTLLSLFAQRLVRNCEYLLSGCRVNADFFLLFMDMKEIPLSSAESVIHHLFCEFHEQISDLYPGIPLSFQVGICLLSEGTHSLEEAVQHAIYTRKSFEHSIPKASKVAVTFYQDSLLSRSNCENRILPLFEDIMTAKHLILYLQPQFHLDRDSVIGAEALVRMMDHSGKLLRPEAFLPILEKYNLAFELDLLVIESVLKLISHWQHVGIEPFPVSVNLSEEDFASPEFLRIFEELSIEYASSMEYLEFEISESSISRNPDYILEAIHTLHQTGCKVCLDGFGKNAFFISSLGIPPVDAVKFDRSVLDISMRSKQNMHVLKKLAEMFDACQIPVICKGIESKLEEDLIKQCDIHYVQGYYYGRPVPIDLFEKKYMMYAFHHAI